MFDLYHDLDQYGICYNSAKNGMIAKKQKANILIEI